MLAPNLILDERTRIRRNERAVFRELADGTGVVLHLETTAYHGVNEVGVLIWTLLESEVTFGVLVGQLGERLDGAPSGLAEDVSEFLQSLSERDLVRLEPPDPT
ncbi:MAG TPA: PqqD family protein [Actinomycetota bacterium]|nr:PqqD family protein [Actinomycetota bacterium]